MNLDRINEHYYGELANPSTVSARQRIHWICGQATGRDVLDIGCSQGIVCLILGREGFQCTGVDLESSSLAIAREALAKEDEIVQRRVSFQVANASELPLEDRSFDTVVLGEVLEHLTLPAKVLSEVRRVLRDNGRIIVTVPYGLMAFHDHKQSYYPISLLELLQPHFRTESIGTLGNYVTYTGVKDPGYRYAEASKELMLEEYLRLEKLVEARCLEKERALLELGSKLNAQIKALKAELSESECRVKKCEELLAVKEEQIRDRQGGHDEARDTIATLRRLSGETKAEWLRLRNEVAGIRAETGVLRKRLAAQQGESVAQRKQLGAKEKALQCLRAALAGAKTAQAAAEQRLAAARSESDATLSKMRQQFAALQAENANQQQELTAREEALAGLRGELADAKAAAMADERQVTALQQSLAAKESDLAGLSSELALLDQRFASGRQQLAALQADLAEKETAVAELKRELGRTAEQLASAELDRQSMQREASAREIDLIGLRSELTRVKSALNGAEEERDALQAEVRQVRQELNQKNTDCQKRLAEVESRHAGRLLECEKGWQAILARRESQLTHALAIQRIRQLARYVLPPGARVLVISKGDGDLLRLEGCLGSHFPQGDGGVYAGHHPTDSAEAIAHLETLRAQGAEFLLIPVSSFWWLDYYHDFRRHLEVRYRLVAYNEEVCLIFALRSPSAEPTPRFAVHFREGVARNGHGTEKAESSVDLPEREPEGVSRRATRAPGDSRRTKAVILGAAETGGTRRPAGQAIVACVLDEFTRECLRPECSLVDVRPDNWKHVIERTPVDLLLVESAWHGNGDSWENKIVSRQGLKGDQLAELVHYCRGQGIPTVFWNKEDPSHFDQFIHRAPLFDLLFTTDANCIPRYREQAGLERVFVLPFAAQPAIHNPVQEEPRDRAVCFAGSYYGDRHHERQRDLDYVLRPAIPFDLEIYDRQHGLTGKGAEAYRFPDMYQPCIRGRLEYEAMLKAYKRYRVFLNVNSVKHSPTMFSRRVFELLACGTPVISTYSRGIIELLGEDVVFITESEADTRRHLERLLGSDEEWARASVRGIRKVMGEHTYRDRLRDVFERAGIAVPEPRPITISVLVPLASEAELHQVRSLLSVQTYRNFDVILLSRAPLSSSALGRFANALPGVAVKNIVGRAPEALDQCRAASSADYIAFLNLRDSYGPNYLKDHSLAAMYLGAEFQGKCAYYEAQPGGARHLKHSGQEFQRVAGVESATLLAKKRALSPELLREALHNRKFQLPDKQVLSIDRFNYLQNAGIIAGVGRSHVGSEKQWMEVCA